MSHVDVFEEIFKTWQDPEGRKILRAYFLGIAVGGVGVALIWWASR